MTGTYKLVKGDLRREGFDLDAVDDPLYVLKPETGSYEPLDAAYCEAIVAGRVRF